MYEASKGKRMGDLLKQFALLRTKNLDELRALDVTQMKLQCRGTHPTLGQVTLSQLLAAWVVHDLNHLHQIAKSMAYQYCTEVGPWREYLSLLPRS